MKNQKFDENSVVITQAEINAGLNLTEVLLETSTDTPAMTEIRRSLREIDTALKSGKSEELHKCNVNITQKHSEILLASSKYHFRKITVDKMINNSFAYQFTLLHYIGKALEGILNSREFTEGLKMGILIGAEYVLDKISQE